MVGPTEQPAAPEPLQMLTLRQLQEEVEVWTNHNFPDRTQHTTWAPLMGVAEEVGELCHAHLKHHQGIRGYDDAKFRLKTEDALGDVLVYLADYCNEVGVDLQAAMEETWGKVKGR